MKVKLNEVMKFMKVMKFLLSIFRPRLAIVDVDSQILWSLSFSLNKNVKLFYFWISRTVNF